MNLHKACQDLSNTIQGTYEFKRLKEAKLALNKKPKLKKSIEDIQSRQMQILNMNISSKEKETQLNELSKQTNDLSKIPEVAQLLKAGEQFDKMMNKVYENIGNTIRQELER